MRYWIHWSLHRFPRLWSFHAVHHSPHRLYWVNSARVHPFEKLAHFTVDIVPFALLGVSKEALAVYYVLWGVTGFYQHSNCDVRFGPLNYVFSGPELHRWHHSELIAESDTNYGNVLIIWDLLFGTWFLPNGRGVGTLGLTYSDTISDLALSTTGGLVGALIGVYLFAARRDAVDACVMD